MKRQTDELDGEVETREMNQMGERSFTSTALLGGHWSSENTNEGTVSLM